MAAAPKLPASIKVGYRDVALKLVDTDVEKTERGTFHSAKAEITICQHLLTPDQAETLIHEVLHACWPNFAVKGKDVEETAVSFMAPVLAQVWRENPQLVAWLSWALQ